MLLYLNINLQIKKTQCKINQIYNLSENNEQNFRFLSKNILFRVILLDALLIKNDAHTTAEYINDLLTIKLISDTKYTYNAGRKRFQIVKAK